MKSLFIGFLTLVSLSAQANVLFDQKCSNNTSEFLLRVYFDDIPGSRIATNVALAELAIKPNGSTIRIATDDGTTEDRVFNDTEKALKFFKSSDIKLATSRGKKFIYSGKNKTLTKVEAGATPIKCRDVSPFDN
jgi:hypothetical protein